LAIFTDWRAVTPNKMGEFSKKVGAREKAAGAPPPLTGCSHRRGHEPVTY